MESQGYIYDIDVTTLEKDGIMKKAIGFRMAKRILVEMDPKQ